MHSIAEDCHCLIKHKLYSMSHLDNLSSEEFAKYDDEMQRILKDFYSTLFNMINMAEQIDPKNYYILWLKQQIDMVRRIDNEFVIKRMKDKLWAYRKEIKERDVNFFKNNQFSKFVKNDDNRSFMYSFINMVKKKLDYLQPEELNAVWDNTTKMLLCCIEYKRLTNDYEE